MLLTSPAPVDCMHCLRYRETFREHRRVEENCDVVTQHARNTSHVEYVNGSLVAPALM